MQNPALVSPAIDDFYSETSEEDRLRLGLGPLEFERNQELIGRHLSPGARILDVGGGPGIYAEWLAKQGYEVILVDPVQKHIRQAGKRALRLKKPFQTQLGEARQLSFADNFADVVILHGPLYHLQDATHRLAALAEAKRVLKPGGLLLGFAITRAASVLPGLLNGLMHVPAFMEMCKEELVSGRHHAPAGLPGILPEAYYHRPAELIEEVTQAGLNYRQLYAVEGMVWLDSKYFETRSDAEKRKSMMDLLRLTETDQALMALSPHMMIAASKSS